jgi:4-hydroxy-L-threonine phosphate dehydrogenase PdxA
VSQRFLRAPFHCGDGGVIGKEDDGIKPAQKKIRKRDIKWSFWQTV